MLTVGKPEEWKNFEDRHRLFFERYSDLREAQDLAFIRPLHDPSQRDLLIFYSGRLAVEDFQEILLLAGNGNGVGALKILRGMYERVVHGRYLSEAPDSEVQNFYDWHWVQKHKLTQDLKQTMGDNFFKDLGYDEQLAEQEAEYQKVRERFLVDHCNECKKKKLNHTWSKLNLLDMAARAGQGIRGLTFEAYYIPLEHTHSSIAAILHRLKETEDGSITFQHDAQRAEADVALQYGYLLLLNAIDLQLDHFKLEQLKEPLARCIALYRQIWLPENETPSGGAA